MLELPLEVVGGLAQFAQPLAQRPRERGQLIRPEQQQRQGEDDDDFRHGEAAEHDPPFNSESAFEHRVRSLRVRRWRLLGPRLAGQLVADWSRLPELVERLVALEIRLEDRLARDPTRLNTVLADVRARGYGTRDATHTGGYYGGPPHADGLFSIAVPLRDGPRVLGAVNMLWLKTAFSVEAFSSRHLGDLQDAAAEIVSSLRRRSRR